MKDITSDTSSPMPARRSNSSDGSPTEGRGVGVTYLEVQDDGPDETQRQLGVAVDNVVRSDVHEFYLRKDRENISQRITKKNTSELGIVSATDQPLLEFGAMIHRCI